MSKPWRSNCADRSSAPPDGDEPAAAAGEHGRRQERPDEDDPGPQPATTIRGSRPIFVNTPARLLFPTAETWSVLVLDRRTGCSYELSPDAGGGELSVACAYIDLKRRVLPSHPGDTAATVEQPVLLARRQERELSRRGAARPQRMGTAALGVRGERTQYAPEPRGGPHSAAPAERDGGGRDRCVHGSSDRVGGAAHARRIGK
jgi:hypothetical protein